MTHGSRTLQLERTMILRGIAVLQVVLLVAVVTSRIPGLVRLPIVVAYVTFVPGLLLSSLLGIDNRLLATKAVYVVGLSFVFVMTIGAVISLFYPLIGIERPLSPASLATTFLLLVVALAALVVRQDTSLTIEVPVRSLFTPSPIALLLLPFVSVLGTVYYQMQGSNVVLLVMLMVIALIPLLLVVTGRLNRSNSYQWYTLAAWVISLALVYHGGSWLPPYPGGVKAGHLTMIEGIWLPNAQGLGGLLPNVILYPTYAILGGVSLAAETALVNPFLVSVLPVVLFEMFRRHTTQLYAFLSCCVFMFSFPFYVLYPVGGRVASPVLFLALTGLALSDREFSPLARSSVTLAFSAGVVVSHYGTAWVAMFALLGAFAFYHTMRVLDRIRDVLDASTSGWRHTLQRILARAPSVPSRYWQSRDIPSTRNVVPSLSFVGAYSVLAVAWYLYTSQGEKFMQLAIKIVNAIQGVLYTEIGGSAANAATKQYGSQIVATSRVFYIIFGALMAVGIAVAVYRRIVKDTAVVDDGFLALGVGFAAIFVGSILPSGRGFAIARVMMIIFTFTLPFVLVGADSITSTIEVVIERTGLNAGLVYPTPSTALAVVLALFLALNAGVVAAVFQQGFSPSTKISQERLADAEDPIERAQATVCRNCIIETHVWIIQHSSQGRSIYGDSYVEAHPDVYRTAIESRVGFNPSKALYTPISTTNESDFDDGYILFLSKNMDANGVYKRKYIWVSFENLSINFRRKAIIYDSGETKIYSAND